MIDNLTNFFVKLLIFTVLEAEIQSLAIWAMSKDATVYLGAGEYVRAG